MISGATKPPPKTLPFVAILKYCQQILKWCCFTKGRLNLDFSPLDYFSTIKPQSKCPKRREKKLIFPFLYTCMFPTMALSCHTSKGQNLYAQKSTKMSHYNENSRHMAFRIVFFQFLFPESSVVPLKFVKIQL